MAMFLSRVPDGIFHTFGQSLFVANMNSYNSLKTISELFKFKTFPLAPLLNVCDHICVI